MAARPAPLEVMSPIDDAVLGEIRAFSPADVEEALARARRAQARWSALSAHDRCRRLATVCGPIFEHLDELLNAVVVETGKPLTEALSMEALPLLELLRAWTSDGPDALKERPRRVRIAPHKKVSLASPPRGVVGIIAPYNFPLAIGGGEALLALAAGNAVLLKASEYTSLCTERFRALIVEAGLDPDLLQVITGGPDTGRALVDAGLDYLSFTGSGAAGREVGAACARRGVPYRLELGGKAACVVRGDADLEHTALALTWGAFANGGQVCAGVQRVFVDERRAAELGQRLVEEAGRLRPGDPRRADTDLGYLCPPPLPAQVQQMADDAVARGARLLYGPAEAPVDRRARPVVLADTPAGSRLLEEECFGPALALVPVSSDDEAIARANAGPGDLCAYLFTEDAEAGEALARRLRAGTVMINDVVWSYGMPEAPWAAVSRSGFGVSHGEEGLRAFCAPQVVISERARVMTRQPFWYPYTSTRAARLRQGLQALYRPGLKDKAKSALRLLKP